MSERIFADFKDVIKHSVIDAVAVEDALAYITNLHKTDLGGVYNTHRDLCHMLNKSESYNKFALVQSKEIRPNETALDAAHIHLATGVFVGMILGLLAAERIKTEVTK